MAKQRRGDARCWRVLGLGLLVAAGVSGPSAPGDATTPTSASASPLQIRDPEVLTAFVDSFIGAAMQREHIPGAAFVFVQDGRVVTMRGYGLADVARKRRVDPQTTIWRIGSISKVFTTIAVLQLVDQGRVALDAPAARYVHRVAVPAAGDSATVRQLLDHTAGFDEIRPGTQAATRDSVLPLDRFLTGRLVPVRAPGRTIAYSTYGMTLAGELVEEQAAMPFESYLARHIWQPLGMRRTYITVPPALENDVAVGYETNQDSIVPQPWEWYHTIPASSINATVADMARFLIANLDPGGARGKRILSEATMREMQRQQVTMDPSMPGFALGFYEDYVGNLRVLEHGGNTAGFSAQIVLVPEARAGFFVVNHHEGSSLRNDLKWSLLQRFAPAARARRPVPQPPPATEVHAERFAGRYAPLTSCWSCRPIRVQSLLQVTANPDGTLQAVGGRWIAVDSLRFVHEKGSGYIVFRADSTGTVRELFAGGTWGWSRIPD